VDKILYINISIIIPTYDLLPFYPLKFLFLTTVKIFIAALLTKLDQIIKFIYFKLIKIFYF